MISRLIRISTILGLVVVLLAGIGGVKPAPVHSQSDACRALVEQALQTAASACIGMGRNDVCYGYGPAQASFKENAGAITFEASGDLAPLMLLDSLVTSPADPAAGTWGVALMKVQADLAGLGNEAMTFTIFGDVEIQQTVPPEPPRCTVTNPGDAINARGGPGTDYRVAGMLPYGGTTSAYERNAAGTWIGTDIGWFYAPLVTLDCPIETLFVTSDNNSLSTSLPMQIFTLNSGESSACEEAPNGLLIQSPPDRRTHLMVNGVQLEFSSSAYLTAAPDQALSLTVLEGQVTASTYNQTVTALAGTQTEIPLAGGIASGPPAEPVAVQDGAGTVQALLAEFNASQASAATQCPLTAAQTVNLRSGPGTVYSALGQLGAEQVAYANTQMVGLDGSVWWRLNDGLWISGDVVTPGEGCAGLPAASTPAAVSPTQATPAAADGGAEAPSTQENPAAGAGSGAAASPDLVTITIEDQCSGGNDIYINGPTTTTGYVSGNSSVSFEVIPGIYDIISTQPGAPEYNRGAYGVQVPPFTYWINCPPNHYSDAPR